MTPEHCIVRRSEALSAAKLLHERLPSPRARSFTDAAQSTAFILSLIHIFLALIIALGCEFFEVAADNGYITLDEFLVKGITLALAVLAIFMVGLTTFKKGIQSVMKGTLCLLYTSCCKEHRG